MWFVKRKDERVEHEELLMSGWLPGYLSYEIEAALQSVTKGKNYQ